MTTQEKTLNEQLREVAQKLVDLEINRKDIVEQQKDLKAELEQLWEDNSELETYLEVNQGMVYLDSKTKFSIPDGLKEEILPHVKNPEKLSQDIIEEFIQASPSLNKKGVKAMREGNVDLAKLVVQEEKSSVKIKI
jgi:phage shock protein A